MKELKLDEIINWPSGNVGIVAIVGRPNVGKSSFLNTVLEYHLVAVSNKPQTTRRNWRGILSDDNSQIIFLDTPGAHVGKTKLGEFMLDDVDRGMADADLILCICDPSRDQGEEDQLIAERVKRAAKETILLVNKADIAADNEQSEAETFYRKIIGQDIHVFKGSALDEASIKPVIDKIRECLPKGPFFYDKEQVSDAFMRDIGSEIIREAALEEFQDEIPHVIAVEIEEWKEKPNKLSIRATLYVERESQKGIVLGQGGNKLKEINRKAVRSLRTIQDLKIDLKIFVKVAPDWRNNKSFLREHGLN